MNKLKSSKMMLVLSVLLVLVMIGSASAADEAGNETVSTSTGVDALSQEVDSVDEEVSAVDTLDSGDANSTLKSSNSNDVLSVEQKGSFSDLNVIIIGTNTGDTLELNKNYVFTTSSDSAYVNGININKQITIDGKGHTIDGSGMAKLFNIGGNNVILKNITCINFILPDSAATGYSSACIEWTGDYGTIMDCNFDKYNPNSDACFIAWTGKWGIIEESTFKNFNKPSTTTVIDLIGEHFSFKSSNFTNCTAYRLITVGISDCNISNCRFTDCHTTAATWSTVIQGAAWSTIRLDNCFFNSTRNIGANNYLVTAGLFKHINNCYFGNGNSGVYAESTPVNVYNCTFDKMKIPIRTPGALSVIDSCRFYKCVNTVPNAINTYGSNGISFINCNFTGGSSYIHTRSAKYVNVENCIFRNLTSAYCIYIDGNKANILNCSFIDNTAATAIYINQNIYCNYNTNTLYFENNKGNIVDRSLGGFTTLQDIWVDNHTNGDGSQGSPANWAYVFSNLLDLGVTIHVLPGIYNDFSNMRTIPCSVVGEGSNVIINKGSFNLDVPYMQINNIVFNNTSNYFRVGSLSSMNNCTFSNIYKTGNYGHNSFFDMYAVVQCNFTNIIIQDSTLDRHVFRSDTWAGAWGCENITVKNSNINTLFSSGNGCNVKIHNVTICDNSKLMYFFNFDSTTSYYYYGWEVSLINITDSKISKNLLSPAGIGSFLLKDVSISHVIYTGNNYLFDILSGAYIENMTLVDVNVNNCTLFNLKGEGNKFYDINLIGVVDCGCYVKSNFALDLIDFDVFSSKATVAFDLSEGSTIQRSDFNDVNFTKCLVVLKDNMKVLNSDFKLCKGNLFVDGYGVEISKSNFTGFINNTEFGNGSAIYYNSGDVIIINSMFRNNTAYHGGAIYISNKTMGNDTYIIDSTFINNRALDFGGGAIFVQSNIYYYINSNTRSSVNNWTLNPCDNDLFDGSTLMYLDDVWVIPGETDLSGADGSYEHPYVFATGYNFLSPYGTLHFKGNGSTMGDNVYSVSYNREIRKPGVIFKGNNTIMSNKFFSTAGFGTNIIISNITFKDYTSGPILYLKGSDAQIIDCNFVNNTAGNSLYGLAVVVLGENCTIYRTSFINNNNTCDDQSVTGGGVGTAIYANASDLNITDCIFEDNGVYDVGAHIYLDKNANNVIINNSKFKKSHNIIGRTNGFISGVYVNSQFGLTIFNSTFDTNYGHNGGAINFASVISNVILMNNTFINNTASNNGGAIIFDKNAIHMVITDNKFINNTASNYGGAVYSKTTLSLSDSLFNENTALYGGAIYVDYTESSSQFDIYDSIFMNNSALNGSAIYNEDKGLNISSTKFASPKYNETNNKVSGYIHSNDNVVLKNVTLSFTDLDHLINNQTNTPNVDLEFNYFYFNDYDGAFVDGVIINRTLIIEGNGFTLDGNNSARVFNISSSVELRDLIIVNGNHTLGGAIYSTGDLKLNNVTFKNNRAVKGSAIYVVKSNNTWNDLTFEGNTAGENATVYFEGNSTVYSSKLSFADNIIPNGLNIVGTDRIRSPVFYVNNTGIGFGIIPSERTTLTYAVNNVLPNSVIYIDGDCDIDQTIRLNHFINVTFVGNITAFHRKNNVKYLFIKVTSL